VTRALLSFVLLTGAVSLPVHDATAVERGAFYQVAQSDGAWWFVRSNGERFVSLGVNCVLPGAKREQYDSAKPAYASFRHYESTDAWADDAVRRLKAWNFNTVGGWSDPSVLRGQLPYIKVLHLGAQFGVPWIDVLADDFVPQLHEFTEKSVAPHRDDPHLLGWCSDNELGWYPDTLFLFHLGQPSTSKTRERLVQLLNDHYRGNFTALTRDFNPSGADNFDELRDGGTLQAVAGGAARQVVLKFTRLYADRYYQAVHTAIRRVDPNHLILGDRYISFCPDPVVQAAGPYVDVVTTNYDWPAGTDGYLPLEYLRRLHTLSGRPVLITEYYVAADENASGNPNSGNIFTTVATQAERAAALETRLRQLLNEPYIVGAHWFCFADEPPGGRPADGEDYNFGLVDIENRTYKGLTEVFADVHSRANDLHAASVKSAAAQSNTGSAHEIPRATGTPLHGISNWKKRGDIAPQRPASCAANLLASWDAEHIYVAVMGLRFVDRAFYPTEDVARSELFHLTFSPGGTAKLVCIQFGTGTDVAVDGKAVECRAWQ
jgi:hypothetical protein